MNPLSRNRFRPQLETLEGRALPSSVHGLAHAPAHDANVVVSAAAAETPVVLSPTSNPYGQTYGQWSAAWWQWALSQPVSSNPLFDNKGTLAANGQSGPVWFLGGNFTGGSTTRNITVPADTALFFPIFTTLADNVGVVPSLGGAKPSSGAAGVPELRDIAKVNVDSVTNLSATLDGKAIPDLQNYRFTSPVFNYTLPDTDNIYQNFGVDVSGQVSPAVADGYYLMLAPLSPGKHKLTFSVTTTGGFSLDITYHIRVKA